jgi:hypothetical protein
MLSFMSVRSVGRSRRVAEAPPLRTLILVGALAIAVCGGCSRAPRARTIVGPDGSDMLHVSCGADQGACFELAGQHCPDGYRLSAIFAPASNNFLVRCQSSRHLAEVVPAESVAPSPSVVPRTAEPVSPPSASWPPPPQPWPNTNPWAAPSPQANANTAATPLPETVRLPNGQIDIGY